jgi:antitoxin (DNA-binding transcriptional repressor) of toxin-antitoxin stability system
MEGLGAILPECPHILPPKPKPKFTTILSQVAAGEEVWIEREDGARVKIVPASDDDGRARPVQPTGSASGLRRSSAR